MNKIPYGRQEILDEDKQAVLDVLSADFLTQGPKVEELENIIGSFVQSKFAFAVNNGTSALHLAALALGVKHGDRVLVATNTFVASANCIRYCGAEVDFVDIDLQNYCIDINDLEKKIKSKPASYYSGIVCVDFAGYPVNTQKIKKIANENKLWIIEDACHALGAKFETTTHCWSHSGSCDFADISVFSFHPVKHLATGEGGLLTTQNPQLAESIRLLRTHGITRDRDKLTRWDGPWYYEMQELGHNFRISDILCALGISQMRRIESNLNRRQQIARIYYDELSKISELNLPLVDESSYHAYHLYVARTKRRDELFKFLNSKEIFPQVHYIPVHMQPYYVDRYGKQNLVAAEEYYSSAISLPMYHALTDSDLLRVIDSIKEFFHG